MNISKTVAMSITPHPADRPSDSSALHIDNIPVDIVKTHKHLGIYFSSDATWHDQPTSALRLFRQRTSLLCHMANRLPHSTVRVLYTTYVLPKLEYGSSVWMINLDHKHHAVLDKLQARVCRSILRRRQGSCIDWYTPKTELFRLCNLSSPAWRIHINALCSLQHLVHHHPEYLQSCDYRLSSSTRRPFQLLIAQRQGTFTRRHLLSVALPPGMRCPPHSGRCPMGKHSAAIY